MAQKDKIKELVGGGLNAYHTKSLQQMDRIEKKNKQQNHKISILSNELDNDYLTKTEEGSVISLEHSKEGMVYLDELQGNTMVNYCTDGSKEMTLNGDIDLEGTFVTTTEGVDGGKVDVMCEGNTLVNLKLNSGEKCGVSWQNSNTVNYFTLSENSSIHLKGEIIETSNVLQFGWCYAKLGKFNTKLLKPNTTYTIILDNHYDWLRIFSLMEGNATNSYHKSCAKISKNIYTVRTKDNFEGLNDKYIILYGSIDGNYKGKVDCSVVAMLEGDWSNKELPNVFFEGMQSVGQDDENGHKIEILSKNKNLTDIIPSNWEVGSIDGTSGQHVVNTKRIRTKNFMLLPKKQGSLNYKQFGNYKLAIRFYDKDYKMIDGTNAPYQGFIAQPKISIPNMAFYYKLVCASNNEVDIMPNEIVNNQCYLGIEEIPTSYIEPKLNKKEILLNEPLRGLPNGVKDRFVKIGGKWYIERNCVGYTPDTSTATFRKNYDVTSIIDFKIDNIKNSNQSAQSFHIECLSTIPYGDPSGTKWQNETHWLKYYPMTKNTISTEGQRVKGSVSIFYNKEWTDQQIIDWCNNNNLKFILPCETPTYEEITDVELITYLDITHISNNSIIPCNMKIKNSGYNAIIKPSTLYTVALDTNKSGTIGMNLGGAKVTTTNNVATITTPATLSDDSLRLYGKGIKGFKVRLLEGDKTNWIPSHFEGMNSSFEDKFDATDNTYKMEISSGNENKITKEYIELMKDVSNYGSGSYRNLKYYIQLEPQTIYTVSCKEYRELAGSYNLLQFADYDSPNKVLGGFPYQNNASGTSDIVFENRSFTITTGLNGRICFRMYINNWTDKELVKKTIESIKDLKIEKGGKTPYVEGKSNKIQFSFMEPLRSVEDIKDRIVLKDDKLMIERNIGQYLVNGNENWTINGSDVYFNFKSLVNNFAINQKTCITSKYPNFKHASSGNKGYAWWGGGVQNANGNLVVKPQIGINNMEEYKIWVKSNNYYVLYLKSEPTYEEIPFELQKIILEGYENGTLFFDTNIPPTSTVTYAGETPIVKATKLNKTEVLNNTTDINDNIIPYLMDMDYRVVCLELATETQGISMARLFGGVYEMLKRDILSKRYSVDEYRHRLDAYLSVNKITEKEYEELGEMLNE